MHDTFGYDGREPDWRLRLAQAFTGQAVLAAVGDFLQAWPAERWRAIPPECQRPTLQAPEDVAPYAMLVLREDLAQCPRNPALRELGSFLADAARRIAQVQRTARPQPVTD